MKTAHTLRSSFAAIAIALLAAFTTPPVSKFTIDKKASTLSWTGKKITGEHTGNVQISSGELVVEGNLIKQGAFDIDLTTISVTDITDADYNAKLVGHLKNDDFFGVEKYPKATFVISAVTPKGGNEYLVKGKLTLKGTTKDMEFPATIKTEGKKLTASAKIVVDRTQFNIRYGSASFFDHLGDKAINNEFELDVKLVANAQ